MSLKDPSIMPKALGYSGLIPFFAGAGLAALGDGDLAKWGYEATRFYGGLILSFLGGINWGLYLLSNPKTRSDYWLVTGVIPSLIGLVGLMIGGSLGLSGLLFGFLFILVDHLILSKRMELPGWFIPLRRNLSLGACLSLAIVLLYLPQI